MTDNYRSKLVSLQVWIHPDIRQRLKVMAAEKGTTITAIVEQQLMDALDTYDPRYPLK